MPRHQPIYLGETPLSGIMGQDLAIPQNLALLSDVGITHAEVGRVLGVSKYTVRGWRRGDRPQAAELTGLVLRGLVAVVHDGGQVSDGRTPPGVYSLPPNPEPGDNAIRRLIEAFQEVA